jgi:hypothetical protein
MNLLPRIHGHKVGRFRERFGQYLQMEKRRALSLVNLLYQIFNLCRSSGKDFLIVGIDLKSSKYFMFRHNVKGHFAPNYSISTTMLSRCDFLREVHIIVDNALPIIYKADVVGVATTDNKRYLDDFIILQPINMRH